MCGIVAVLRRSGTLDPPSETWLVDCLESARGGVPTLEAPVLEWADLLVESSSSLETVDRVLRSLAGTWFLLQNEPFEERLAKLCHEVEGSVSMLEDGLDSRASALDASRLEALNASFVRLRDALWALRHDRLTMVRSLRFLGRRSVSAESIEGLSSIEMVLSALDRLEVRGRDSAGVHVLVSHPNLGEAGPEVESALEERLAEPLFRSGAIRRTGHGALSLVYKTSAEIGELGDNGAVLRKEIREDPVLRSLLQGSVSGKGGQSSQVAVLGHTRWASVGLINEANAHPLNHEELGEPNGPYVVAALNGDVDNYRDLSQREELALAEEITTDAKVIPVLISRRLAEGLSLEEAFRRTVTSFSGSVAIAAQSATEPGKILLALYGSGQALYVGLMEDGFIVASEPYGVVEQASSYLRLDGETPGNPESPNTSRGQIVVLDARLAGKLEGIRRFAYDGTPLPVSADEFVEASITTRDIDRGAYPHYLLKEITQAAESFRKTLRGKLIESKGKLRVALGPSTLPDSLIERMTSGSIGRILVIGQGTAAVAGHAIVEGLRELLPRDRMEITALPATELSGFRLRADMSDSLVVAISQSGTTTDTNRTVDLVRSRGAAIVSIVNRRGSDLTDKSDGVLYTSDGRDVEMSVASTKAFYSQIAAGFLLGSALNQALGGDHAPAAEQRLLGGLRSIPKAMDAVLDQREKIAVLAQRYAPGRRYWAVVGNGSNRAAAEEIRIKLSELCYKSIACDATEDKKHIDLSSEPLILVCATGLSGSILDDVSKEVAIYKAHRAAPIVILSEGEQAFNVDAEVITVPQVHPQLAFILSTMVGHIFGYEAALAIDSQADPLREIRGQIEDLASAAEPGEDLLGSLAGRIEIPSARLFADIGSGRYNGALEASTATRLLSLLRYVTGLSPLESYITEHDEVGSPSLVIEALTEAVTRAIEELTRPIDAIKHQAKTVTVGISRSDEALLTVPLVKEVLRSGLPRGHINYRDLRSLAGLDPAIAEVRGFTRYSIVPGEAVEASDLDSSSLEVIDRGGISTSLPSRTTENPELRGTKHMVADERRLLVARGLSDGRTVVLIPEIDRSGVIGILLLHVRFHETRSVTVMCGVLSAYRNRFAVLRDAVMETQPEFREELLAEVPVTDLLTEPVAALAERWQTVEAPSGGTPS